MYLIILVLVVIFCGGCQSRHGEEAAAAQVGHYRLSQSQVSQAANAVEYIDSWVETSLLALEAEKRNLAQERKFQAEMESLRSRLLMELLLEKEYAGIGEPADSAIADYYRGHKNEFRRMKRELEITAVSGLDDDSMAEAARQMRRGLSAEEVLQRLPGLQAHSDLLVNPATMPAPFSGLDNISAGAVIGPLEAGRGKYVIRVDAIYEAGTVKPMEQVREAIIFQLMEDARSRVKELLIKQLREKYKPEVYTDRLRAAGINIGEGE